MSSVDVDHDLLADYLGGALDGTPQKDHVEQLVATSPQWRAAAEEMSAAFDLVARDLTVLRETPEEMPADLAAQFDELLAPAPRDPLAARPIARTDRRKRRWKRWAAPIAVAAAALTFFAVGRLPEVASNMSGAGRDSGTEAAAPLSDQPQPASALGVTTARTGTQYDRANLGMARMTADRATGKSYAQESLQSGEPWARLLQLPDLSACLHAVSLALPGRATHVEYAFFEGKPALVISVTAADNVWRFAAGMSCGLGGADELHRAPLQ